MLDADACYRALVARDARFDGVFFVGVTTTGVYCRPVCPARTPGRARCVFFQRPAEAERDGYRACFRCRPELAPGTSRVDAVPALVRRAVARVEAGALDEGSVDDLAREMGITSRHLRRAVTGELGVTLVGLAQTTRLAMAKQLLQDSGAPLAEVAFASGFASLRRFNALFRARFGRSPSAVRRVQRENAARRADASPAGDSLPLTLGHRPPLAWDAMLAFLSARATPGVELVGDGTYARTIRIGGAVGTIVARHVPDRRAVRVDVSGSLSRTLVPLAARLRRAFDLDAHPGAIDAHLARDPALRARVGRTPGLRVPGCVDGFELATRAVLGQQVTVRGATTLAGRLAEAFGDPIETPLPSLARLAPTADRIASASQRAIAAVGLPATRARTLLVLAEEVARGRLVLEPHADVDATIAALERLPGIGPWTARYVAMRALGAPDALPTGDLALRRAVRGDLDRRAERWRPWRAYAAMHLWRGDD
jgi:AraC family transcriptional regulator of adaptative response / DNA-3-methyladenine glycosylase II